MDVKTAPKEVSQHELEEELKEIKSWKSKGPKDHRLMEITKHLAMGKKWDKAIETLQLISNEKDRNLMIADVIESGLLPANEISMAKNIAKYLTPNHEIESLIRIKIALAENNSDEATKIAEHLSSPISRNFAFLQIMESHLNKKNKNKVNELQKQMIENIRTIYDNKTRSYILRELALNLFLSHNEKEHAKEMAALIPDETIRTKVIGKINKPK